MVALNITAPNGQATEVKLVLQSGIIDKDAPYLIVENVEELKRSGYDVPYAVTLHIRPTEEVYCTNYGPLGELYYDDADHPHLMKVTLKDLSPKRLFFVDKVGNQTIMELPYSNFGPWIPYFDSVAPTIHVDVPENANATNSSVSVTVTANEQCTLSCDNDAVTCGTMSLQGTDSEGNEIWMAGWNDTRTKVVSKGIYVSSEFTVNRSSDTSRIAALDKLLELCKRTELNTMVIDVKYESGAILYNFDNEKIRQYGTVVECLSFIPEYIQKLHEAGVYVVARLVCFKDTRLAAARPDLAFYNTNGTLYADNNKSNWVSPYKQEVWEYIAEVGKECAKIGFDEINLDYVRFPTDKITNIVWGEESKTVTKTEAITKGIKYLCETLRECNVYISADVYGIVMSSPKDAANVGQDFTEMGRYLDYLCPMVYPSHYDKSWVSSGDWPDKHPYEVITKSLKYSVTALNKIAMYHHRAEVRPWLQDFTADYLGKDRYLEYGPEEVLA